MNILSKINALYVKNNPFQREMQPQKQDKHIT